MGSNKQAYNFSKFVGRVSREIRNTSKFGRESRDITQRGRTNKILVLEKNSIEKVETYGFLVEKVETHLKGQANTLFENFAEAVEKAGKSEFLVEKLKTYLCGVEQANFQYFIKFRSILLRKANISILAEKFETNLCGVERTNFQTFINCRSKKMKHVEIWPRKTKHISVGSIKQVSNFFKNCRSRKLKHIEFWSRKSKHIYRFEQIHFSKTSAETVEKAGKSEFLVVKVKKCLCRVEQANFQSFINCRLRKLRKAKHIDIGQKIRNISMRCRTNKFF